MTGEIFLYEFHFVCPINYYNLFVVKLICGPKWQICVSFMLDLYSV